MPQLVDGRYELEEVIGSGGMATVWRGRDTQLDRLVAVKRPHPLPPGDPRHDRLAREARLAASVSHPNLVEVHDAGSDENGLFLVMEFIDAPSLREIGPSLDRSQLLTAGAQVARALTAVHAANVVHRDVKPSNVLLPTNGAKLLDFGVALAGEPMSGFEPTVAGVVFGTRGYAAPEVLAGQPATAASDIYAVGVMMYEFLAGKQPFPEGNMVVAAPVLDDPAGPFLAQCLALDPADRPSAASAAGALQQLVAGEAPGALSNPPKSSIGYEPTVEMTSPAGHPTTADAPPTAMRPPLTAMPPPPTGSQTPPFSPPAPAPDPVDRVEPVDNGQSSGDRIGWAVLVGVALFALVAFVVNRSLTDTDEQAETSIPVSTVPATSSSVVTTTSTTVTTATTATPTTAPSTTVGGPDAEADAALSGLGDDPDEEQARELAYDTLKLAIRGGGKPDDTAQKVAKKIGEAVKENRQGKPDEALEKLEDGAEEAAKGLDGFNRIWALSVLDSAARRMGLEDPGFTIRFDETNPLNGEVQGDEEDD